MTNPNFRALCAELLHWAERTSSHYYKQPDVILRARAALAQPEPAPPGELYFDIEAGHVAAWRHNARAALDFTQPEYLAKVAPTDDELKQLLFNNHRRAIEFACDTKAEGDIVIDNHIDFARAVLARWGAPTNTINQDN